MYDSISDSKLSFLHRVSEFTSDNVDRAAACLAVRPFGRFSGRLIGGKMKIVRVNDKNEKMAVSRQILENLTDWFAIPEGRERYIAESAEQLFFAAYHESAPVGFIALKETGKDTAELAVMGVLRQFHRRGIGRALFEAARRLAAEQGYSFVQVKTIRMGVYDDYDATNRFYLSLGFREFEVLPLWGDDDPCQVYVMYIGS